MPKKKNKKEAQFKDPVCKVEGRYEDGINGGPIVEAISMDCLGTTRPEARVPVSLE